MDVRAGAAIMRGPRNILAALYATMPIGITVEGANILTRSMIIFGQGAIRCHPFALEEIRAVEAGDVAALRPRVLRPRSRHVLANAARAFVLGLTRGRLARAPRGPLRRHVSARFGRASAAFALVSDAAMAHARRLAQAARGDHGPARRRARVALPRLGGGEARARRRRDGEQRRSRAGAAEHALA